MPCTDPRDVTCLAEAFDLSTPEVQRWELELIWKAMELDLIVLSPHARREAKHDSISLPAVWRVIGGGTARSKDITKLDDRQIGINFEGRRRGGGRLRAKVTWRVRYVVATVHAL